MSLEEPAPPVDPAGAIGNALPVPNPARRGPNTTKDADGNTIPPPAPVVAAPLPTAFVNTGTKSVRVFSFPSTLLDLIEDDSQVSNIASPPHSALINYPGSGVKGEGGRGKGATVESLVDMGGRRGLVEKNGEECHCVMCGRGTKTDNIMIPVQNKSVCSDCDTGVWLFQADQTYFKWCKGCKRFHNILSFREKLKNLRSSSRSTKLPSKCDVCRNRGRLGYRAKKEAGDDGLPKKRGPKGTKGAMVVPGAEPAPALAVADSLLGSGFVQATQALSVPPPHDVDYLSAPVVPASAMEGLASV